MSVVVHGSIYALKLSFLLIKEGGRLCCDCTRPRGNATFGRSHMQGMNGRRRQDKKNLRSQVMMYLRSSFRKWKSISFSQIAAASYLEDSNPLKVVSKQKRPGRDIHLQR